MDDILRIIYQEKYIVLNFVIIFSPIFLLFCGYAYAMEYAVDYMIVYTRINYLTGDFHRWETIFKLQVIVFFLGFT